MCFIISYKFLVSSLLFLSSFSKFLIKHKKNKLFQDIIQKGLDRFINHQILQFQNAKEIPIHFIGSVSFYLKDEIKKALKLFDKIVVGVSDESNKNYLFSSEER